MIDHYLVGNDYDSPRDWTPFKKLEEAVHHAHLTQCQPDYHPAYTVRIYKVVEMAAYSPLKAKSTK